MEHPVVSYGKSRKLKFHTCYRQRSLVHFVLYSWHFVVYIVKQKTFNFYYQCTLLIFFSKISGFKKLVKWSGDKMQVFIIIWVNFKLFVYHFRPLGTILYFASLVTRSDQKSFEKSKQHVSANGINHALFKCISKIIIFSYIWFKTVFYTGKFGVKTNRVRCM